MSRENDAGKQIVTASVLAAGSPGYQVIARPVLPTAGLPITREGRGVRVSDTQVSWSASKGYALYHRARQKTAK